MTEVTNGGSPIIGSVVGIIIVLGVGGFLGWCSYIWMWHGVDRPQLPVVHKWGGLRLAAMLVVGVTLAVGAAWLVRGPH